MAKRKASKASNDNDDVKPKQTILTQRQKTELKEEEEEDELESDQDCPPAKKSKAEKVKTTVVKAPSEDDAGDVVVRSTSDGDKYIDLGKKKRATVRSFKGTVFVDIREFYGADGDEKPGKKGISLGLEQWEALKRSSTTIDELFAAQNK